MHIQDYSGPIVVRSAAILTGAYVAGTTLSGTSNNEDKNLAGMNQLMVLIDFTIGSLTDGRVKIEFSADGTNFYQEVFQSIAADVDTMSLGYHKMTASGSYRLPVEIKDRFIKISAIGTGDTTGSSMTINAAIGIA